MGYLPLARPCRSWAWPRPRRLVRYCVSLLRTAHRCRDAPATQCAASDDGDDPEGDHHASHLPSFRLSGSERKHLLAQACRAGEDSVGPFDPGSSGLSWDRGIDARSRVGKHQEMSFMAAITCGARRSLIVSALAALAPVTKKEKKRVERRMFQRSSRRFRG
jgi:hypothetical protein